MLTKDLKKEAMEQNLKIQSELAHVVALLLGWGAKIEELAFDSAQAYFDNIDKIIKKNKSKDLILPEVTESVNEAKGLFGEITKAKTELSSSIKIMHDSINGLLKVALDDAKKWVENFDEEHGITAEDDSGEA